MPPYSSSQHKRGNMTVFAQTAVSVSKDQEHYKVSVLCNVYLCEVYAVQDTKNNKCHVT